MNEINEVVILAAGISERMGELTREKPKCLLPYKDMPILVRLLNQLKKYGIKRAILVVGHGKERVKDIVKSVQGIKIDIVENDRYEEDTNIYSMKLALENVSGPIVIFEADAIMEDKMVEYVVGSDFEEKSVWFTCGKFNKNQAGGILASDKFGNITDIRIVPEYDEKFKEYSKLTGVMRISAKELPGFKKLIKEYAEKTIKQYYLVPWIENLSQLPCTEGNAEHYIFRTYNIPEEYKDIKGINFDLEIQTNKEIKLIEVEKLKHIEGFDEGRVNLLTEQIKKDNFWARPLYIEKNHNLVLDGQHRIEAAIKMGLKYVPVLGFNYEDVKIWTLRKEEEVDILRVIERANKGDIYPYKTVKHKFPNVVSKCKINLDDLKNKSKEEIVI